MPLLQCMVFFVLNSIFETKSTTRNDGDLKFEHYNVSKYLTLQYESEYPLKFLHVVRLLLSGRLNSTTHIYGPLDFSQ